jgi:protoporphyrinogen oxidase
MKGYRPVSSLNIAVVGTGFRGFCDVAQLLKVQGVNITMIEHSDRYGGLVNSSKVGPFWVDRGVHMFDSIPEDLAELITSILNGRVNTVEFKSISRFNNTNTNEFSMPDLSSLDMNTLGRIRSELLSMEDVTRNECSSLDEYFNRRFGPTVAEIYSKIFSSVYGLESSAAQVNAIDRTSLGRVRFGNDREMIELKLGSQRMDQILAARRSAIGKIDSLVSIYPNTKNGMQGWAEASMQWLLGKGVKIQLGTAVKEMRSNAGKVSMTTTRGQEVFDHVIWANDDIRSFASAMGIDEKASALVSPTPMIIATMFTDHAKVQDFTYMQNFDHGSISYRTASAGIYSNQIINGTTFITAECPSSIVEIESLDKSVFAERLWDELRSIGVIDESAQLEGFHVEGAKRTFKVGKLGFDAEINKVTQEARERARNVLFRDPGPFFRKSIYLDSKDILEKIGI